MPAATAEKRARQRANKFSRTESITIPIVQSAGTPELETLPTSADPVTTANSVALKATPLATTITAATALPASSALPISVPKLTTKPLRAEPATTSIVPPVKSPELVSLPAEPAAFASALPSSVKTDSDESVSWPIPAPITFTISYTPLAISYPEPTNSAAKLPTDAVRVTRTELANMLRQSYAQGTEHGWKENVGRAKERLQADYEKDMQDATVKFGLHEKLIREEEFERGFKDGRDVGRNTQLTLMKERLNAEYQKRHLEAVENFASRSQEVGNEEFIRGFTSGRDAAIRDELGRQASLLSCRVNSGMQTDILQCLCVDFSSQTDLPEPARFISVGFGTQTDPLETEFSIPPLPIPIISSNPVINSPHISNNLSSVPPSPIPDSLALSTLTSPSDNPPTFISKPKPHSLSSSSITFNIPPHPIKPSPPFIRSFSYDKQPITPPLISVPHPEPPTILTPPPPFLWSDEPSDIPLLPQPPPTPLSPSKTTALFPARDFSELRSGANPWRSLRRHRNRRDCRLSTKCFIQPHRQYSQSPYTSNYVFNNLHVPAPRPYAHVPHPSYPSLPHPPTPDPPPPLDWDVDPRLLELSRVLKTLGWVRPSTPRP